MITLEQIRLLEDKIARAIDLIRVLKEENATLRKGLDSAGRRMRELETLVDGFKTDQKEIETVIVRTLKNLDDLEESVASGRATPREAVQEPRPNPAQTRKADLDQTQAVNGVPFSPQPAAKPEAEIPSENESADAADGTREPEQEESKTPEPKGRGELDIF